MALVLITHNMGVVSEMAQRVAVMYAGQVMEQRRVARAVRATRSIPTPRRCWRRCPSAAPAGHGWRPSPASCPACSTGPPAACSRRAAPMPPRIRVAVRPELRAWQGGQVRCHYPLGDPQRDAAIARDGRRSHRRGRAHERASSSRRRTCARSTRSAAACSAHRRSCRPSAASRSRSRPGKTLAVVGESGCGKSTLARMVALIEKPTDGQPDARRHRRGGHAARASGAAAPGGAAGVPEPVRLAQPAQEDRRRAGRAAGDQHRPDARPSARERARAMLAQVGPAARVRQPLSAHVLRRPAPAHRDRARADAQPQAAGGRRAGVGARRLDPGPGAEPAGRPAGANSSWPICSSRTTWRWCATSRTRCW